MPNKTGGTLIRTAWTSSLICGLVFLFSTGGWASSEKILYRFPSDGSGELPYSGLLLTPNGILYGTTAGIEPQDQGTVFELRPETATTESEFIHTVLYRFLGGTDGSSPCGDLITDGKGNLFGTTQSGGAFLYYGTVFELSPPNDGSWHEIVLHSFSYSDGAWPYAGLLFDGEGNLYGTAVAGGPDNHGVVFELSPKDGAWIYTPIFDFDGTDGGGPQGGLSWDHKGNLWGTTGSTIFELSPSNGVWVLAVNYFLDGTNGLSPLNGRPAIDQNGIVYGTTAYGGTYDNGTVWQLQQTNGVWTETVLYSFSGGGDGAYPEGSVRLSQGHLFGTTLAGGEANSCGGTGCGVVFELSSQVAGAGAIETVLHKFSGTGTGDGANPVDRLTTDPHGNLLGTTQYGGDNKCNNQNAGCGSVFKVIPE